MAPEVLNLNDHRNPGYEGAKVRRMLNHADVTPPATDHLDGIASWSLVFWVPSYPIQYAKRVRVPHIISWCTTNWYD